MSNYGMSQAAWRRHAAVVQVPEPADAWLVHLDNEPPLSPEEEEALSAVAAGRVVQNALF